MAVIRSLYFGRDMGFAPEYVTYLLAVIEQLERDAVRLEGAYDRTNRSPLGACAITGTGFDHQAWCTCAKGALGDAERRLAEHASRL